MSTGGPDPRPAAFASLGRLVDPSKVDVVAAERAALELLRAIGADIDAPDLLETPRRVAASLAELVTTTEFAPTSFPVKHRYDELVLVRDIAFNTLCMHHWLPFFGQAHIAYLP